MRDPDTERLEAVPGNRAVLNRLRAAAEPARSEYRLGAHEQHAHPDLAERLDGVAGGGLAVAVYGLPGRAARDGLLYAIAIGTNGILLRLPSGIAREEVIANGGSVAEECGPDWVRADAWLSAVPQAAGTALLASWVAAAREAAGEVGSA